MTLKDKTSSCIEINQGHKYYDVFLAKTAAGRARVAAEFGIENEKPKMFDVTTWIHLDGEELSLVTDLSGFIGNYEVNFLIRFKNDIQDESELIGEAVYNG